MILPPLPTEPSLRDRIAPAGIALAAIVAIDQLTKRWVVEGLDLQSLGRIDFSPIVNFRMAWNTGVNFGLLSGDDDLSRILLIAVTGLLAIGLMAGSLWTTRRLSAIGLGVAAGGAIGNIIDRLTWGAVADFLNVSCCGITNPWSFNVADIAIFVGLGLLLLPAKKAATRDNA